MSLAPTVLGSYQVLREVADGGMGTVYEAVHTAIERRVAIKVLHPELAGDAESLARFFNEARAINRVEHPSLVQVFDYGRTAEGAAYIVMEFLRGETLAERLRRLQSQGETAPLRWLLRMMRQIPQALAAAHEHGIVHRDLKPANIMLTPDPTADDSERAKLLDFGIAKLTRGEHSKTATHTILGTPAYMSPEQCRGAGGVDERTDSYSLGVILFELAANRPPFLGTSSGELIGQHIYIEAPFLGDLEPTLPGELTKLIHKLLRKDRTQRPAMSHVVDEIARILDSAALRAPAEGTERSAAKTPEHAPAAEKPGCPSTIEKSAEQGNLIQLPVKRRILAVGLLACVAVATTIWGVAMRSGARRGTASVRPALPSGSPGAGRLLPDLAAEQNAPSSARLVPLSGPTAPPSDVLQPVGRLDVTRPAAPRKVRWHLRTTPVGATVVGANGDSLGVTPWEREAVATSGNQTIRLRLKGFNEHSAVLDASKNEELNVNLVPKPAGKPKPLSRFSIKIID